MLMYCSWLPTASPSISIHHVCEYFPHWWYIQPPAVMFMQQVPSRWFQIAAFLVSHSRQSTNKPDCYSQHQFSLDVIIPALSHCSCVFHIPVLSPSVSFSLAHTLALVSFPLLCSSSLWHSFLCPFHVLTSQNSPACLPAAIAPGGFGGMIKWRWCALQLFFFFFLHPAAAV